jgi:hypothetical protein
MVRTNASYPVYCVIWLSSKMPVIVTAMKAAHPEIGTRMMTGAAVESTR